MNLGNHLYQLVTSARVALFEQGEFAQLTYSALDSSANAVKEAQDDEIVVTFPVGYRADKTTIDSSTTYKKDDLINRIQFLAVNQLSNNGVIKLVTIVETVVSDIIRTVVLKYPQKLSGKRTIPIKLVLESSSIEEVHRRVVDGFLNELSYMSPSNFAEAMQQVLSLNLLECPAFHKYIEVKATRDIIIHNQGIANEVYLRKAGTHARVKEGMSVPVDVQYFLESYESCIQIMEWLEIKLNEHWHSSELEERTKNQLDLKLQNDTPDDKTV